VNRLQYGNWIPGGVLRVYSKRHHVWHVGIPAWVCVGPMVMHASKDRGHFVLTTLDEFAQGQPMQYTWLPDSFEAQQAVLGRAESLLGRPFRLLNANCEDYVNWIVTGVARSPQREQFALAALVLLFIGGVGGLLLVKS
jgi:Lecithin retinol acyltransferase